MDFLFSPWRYRYVTGQEPSKPGGPGKREGVGGDATGCIFCDKLASDRDEENLILHRGPHCFVVLNNSPYNPGHLMVLPNREVGELAQLDATERAERAGA